MNGTECESGRARKTSTRIVAEHKKPMSLFFFFFWLVSLFQRLSLGKVLALFIMSSWVFQGLDEELFLISVRFF